MDLEGFALRELLEFMRQENPTWPEGAVLDEVPVEVDGKVLVQLLMHKARIAGLERVLSRTLPRDEDEKDAVNSLLRALGRWAEGQAGERRPSAKVLHLVKAASEPGEHQ